MEDLLFTTYPNTISEDNQNMINLDISCINKKDTNNKIDISKASITELSDLIVSDMLKNVREDLSSIKIRE